MTDRRRTSRVCRATRVAMAPSTGPDAAHTILTVTDNTGVALVTTAAPHGLGVGATIVITGTSGGLYDGTFNPTVISPTTFDIDTGYTSFATGGSWRLA